MNGQVRTWLLIAAAMTLTSCETVSPNVLEKNALSGELRNETMPVSALPAGCKTVTTIIPAAQTSITVSYQEPTTNQNKVLLTQLGYTTIYVSSAKGPTQAIRVWTNDARGGALVTIHDIPAPAQELGVCVTASNWNRQESPPALPTNTKQ